MFTEKEFSNNEEVIPETVLYFEAKEQMYYQNSMERFTKTPL